MTAGGWEIGARGLEAAVRAGWTCRSRGSDRIKVSKLKAMSVRRRTRFMDLVAGGNDPYRPAGGRHTPKLLRRWRQKVSYDSDGGACDKKKTQTDHKWSIHPFSF